MASGDDPVIGKLGRVTHPIRPGHPGEVVLHIRGGTEIYMAVADTELPRDTEVLVIGHVSARTLQVTAFAGGSFETTGR
ncbi:MAG TPA: hypothetical protein VKI19_00390 [Acidimicrobiales bacterium]|nr:hypothetical protein [Acidimicrobiales bacterium]